MYNPETGSYVELWNTHIDGQEAVKECNLPENTDLEKFELKNVLPQLVNKAKPCTVCAKGALCISGIAKFNNFKLSDIEVLDDEASEYVQKIFGKENANKMECYFENSEGFMNNKSLVNIDHINAFNNKYSDEQDRLLVILKNALKNKGIFKPNQIKVEIED